MKLERISLGKEVGEELGRPLSELTPTIIEEIAPNLRWISIRGPFSLITPVIKPFPYNGAADFLRKLANPNLYEPYQRWQFTRRLVNPLWNKGSGFEGHFIGLEREEMLAVLKKYDDAIWRFVSILALGGSLERKKELQRFLNDPSQPISLDFAYHMRVIFETLLARARAIRSNLQIENQENRQFQGSVYSIRNIISNTIWTFNNYGVLSLISENSSPLTKSIDSGFGDVRLEFPAIAEIGRFGYPPLGLIIKKFYDSFPYS